MTIDRMAKWQPERNKWLLLAILLITPVMAYFSFRVKFDDDLMHLNYLSPRMQQAQDEVWGDDATVRISSSYAPMGAGVVVDGGYLVSGAWQWS